MDTTTLYLISLHVVQGVFTLLLAPLVIGTLRLLRARLQRRQGPALFQFYRDLWKLLKKEPTLPEAASPLFILAPALVFACYAALAFLVPVAYLPPESGPRALPGDLLVFVYLLGLARLVLGLAGLDAGAPFGGLGSSRELLVHVLSEPTLLIIVFTIALRWETTDIYVIIWQNWHILEQTSHNFVVFLVFFPLLIAIMIVLLLETGR